MNKILVILLCLAFVMSCSACSSTNSKIPEKESENVSTTSDIPATLGTEPCQHVFKENIHKEPGYGYDGMKVKYCTICYETEYLPIPALPGIFELSVKGKTVSTQGNECYVLFDIEIENTSDKTIEQIAGNLSVMPPDCILELVCEFDDLSLAPHSTTRITSHGYSFDSTSSDDTVEKKVYDAEFNTINFFFSPSNVVVAE
ncbi:MAG: hypothetical protein IJV82_00825 [Oscillospiraceae bacterium]|nr:hypothetical protein [Oscillospiraceae bacterium]